MASSTAGRGGQAPAQRVVGAHEFRGGAARDLRDAGLQALFVFDLARELGIREAILLEGLGFGFAHASGDILFDVFLIHKPRLRRSRLAKPRSSRICRNRLRARLNAWLNAASVRSIS